MKSRPYRIYKHKGRRTGRYLRREGKRVYIKTQKKMSDKALVNVMIKNTINGHRRVRTVAPIPKSEHKPLAYSQPIASTLKTVPHTPFFSHNDQTKEKKLTDEIIELKKIADKKEREHTEAQNLSKSEVKKAGDEVKKAIEDKKNSEFKTKQQERLSFFQNIKAEAKNQNKLREHTEKYDKLHKASIETIDRQEKDHAKNLRDQNIAHKKDSLEKAMESESKSKHQKKTHEDHVQRIITERPPPVHKQTHAIATGDHDGAIGDNENVNQKWNPANLSIPKLKNMLYANDIPFDDSLSKAELTQLVRDNGLLVNMNADQLHARYFKADSVITVSENAKTKFPHPEENKDEGGANEHKGDPPDEVFYDADQGGDGVIHIGADGMGTSQIEDFLKGRTHHIIPCIPRDEMDSLLPYVSKNTKEFGFVFNSENHTQGGQHWRACYINTETGDCDFFDSLVSEPDKVFMKGITEIIKKIDPPIYLKFKINRVKIQSNTSANCGQFCCQFLDKMYHGGTFRQATYYDCINGEKDVNKYKSKWGLL